MWRFVSLVPRPLSFFVLLFAFGVNVVHRSGSVTKNGKGLGLFIMWTMSGGREMDIEWRDPNCKNNKLDHSLYRSSGLQMLAWLKLLILRNSLMSIVDTYLNIDPSPLCPSQVHPRNEWDHLPCFFFFLFLPFFCFCALHWTQSEEQKTGEAWERS